MLITVPLYEWQNRVFSMIFVPNLYLLQPWETSDKFQTKHPKYTQPDSQKLSRSSNTRKFWKPAQSREIWAKWCIIWMGSWNRKVRTKEIWIEYELKLIKIYINTNFVSFNKWTMLSSIGLAKKSFLWVFITSYRKPKWTFWPT